MSQARAAAPVRLGDRFTDAVALAADLHRTQVRKGTGVPYLTHLLGVTSLVLEDGGDEDEAIAALLHDAVEDAGGQPILQAIRVRFGDRVAGIVGECTDYDPDGERPPWRPRKEATIAKVATLSPSGLRVSLADKLHNARSIHRDLAVHGDALWSRFTAGRDAQLWYLRGLADAYATASDSQMADELRAVVAGIERLAAGPVADDAADDAVAVEVATGAPTGGTVA